MDDFVDERLRHMAFFENFLKNENAPQSEENKQIVEAHTNWRKKDGGKFEYSLLYVSIASSLDEEYSLVLKTGDELTLEEEEIMYLMLESNMKEMDERNGNEWNAAKERALCPVCLKNRPVVEQSFISFYSGVFQRRVGVSMLLSLDLLALLCFVF